MKFPSAVFIISLSVGSLMAAPAAAQQNGAGLDCMIEPSSSVNVGSEVPGIIGEVLVDRGDIVQKGQVLVRLESAVEHAAMESRRARYEFAVNEHRRKSELFAKGFIPARDVDESDTNLKITQRDFEEAEKVYDRRTIRSPIEGIVVQRLLQPGERVEEQPILKLAQLSPLYVEVIAPASMLGSVKAGDRAAVRPENPITGKYIGRVKIVDKVVDAPSGTFGIRIELENKDYTLPSGLKCRVQFLGKGKTPKEAAPAAEISPQNTSQPKPDTPAALLIKQPLP